MRRYAIFCALGAFVFALDAAASPNDFQISTLGDPSVSPTASGNFRAFARELGAALNASDLNPPNSLGVNGFSLTAEDSVVSLSPNSSFLMPTQQPFSSPLMLPAIHIRKGLPLSLEVGARLAYLNNSSMGSATGELKWAFTEGMAYVPTIAARAFLTRLFNTPDFELSSGGVDLIVGKRFAVGGMITLTPYAAYGIGWSSAFTQPLDFAPNRDPALAQSSPAQSFANYQTYSPVTAGANLNNRFYAGVRFMGGVIQIGAELSYVAVGSFNDPTGQRSLPGVAAFNANFGLDF